MASDIPSTGNTPSFVQGLPSKDRLEDLPNLTFIKGSPPLNENVFTWDRAASNNGLTPNMFENSPQRAGCAGSKGLSASDMVGDMKSSPRSNIFIDSPEKNIAEASQISLPPKSWSAVVANVDPKPSFNLEFFPIVPPWMQMAPLSLSPPLRSF